MKSNANIFSKKSWDNFFWICPLSCNLKKRFIWSGKKIYYVFLRRHIVFERLLSFLETYFNPPRKNLVHSVENYLKQNMWEEYWDHNYHLWSNREIYNNLVSTMKHNKLHKDLSTPKRSSACSNKLTFDNRWRPWKGLRNAGTKERNVVTQIWFWPGGWKYTLVVRPIFTCDRCVVEGYKKLPC